jgi:hypothetical protein
MVRDDEETNVELLVVDEQRENVNRPLDSILHANLTEEHEPGAASGSRSPVIGNHAAGLLRTMTTLRVADSTSSR